MVNQNEILASLRRWRTLTPKSGRRILQVFSDRSPSAWWSTRLEPSLKESREVTSSFISTQGVHSQVVSAAAIAKASVVVFHRHTLSITDYERIASLLPGVFPYFVVPGIQLVMASKNNGSSWARLLDAARAGKCGIVVEKRTDIREYGMLGVGAKYLPPVYDLLIPQGAAVRGEVRLGRYLLSSSPHQGSNVLAAVSEVSQASDFSKLVLSFEELGGFDADDYRQMVVGFAEHFCDGRVEVWPYLNRREFQIAVASGVDAVIDPDPNARPLAGVSQEAIQLGLPVYHVTAGSLASVYAENEDVRQCRQKFWEDICG